MNTNASMPAAAECADTEFARLPVLAHAIAVNPNWRARAIAMLTTRSLNDHVGFVVSFFNHSVSRPRRFASRSARISGVKPVPMSTLYCGSTGSSGAYRHSEAGPRSIESVEIASRIPS